MHESNRSETRLSSLLTEYEVQCLCSLANVDRNNTAALQIFKGHVSHNTWVNNVDAADVMKAPLMRLCARYLYLEKRRAYALNSVGR